MNQHRALIVVDMQRGFMPASEGERLRINGFGELPVQGGETLVPSINRLMGWAALKGFDIATTQDWHPHETAHFAAEGAEPDYTTTWPRHCVDGTPGAELHPELSVPHTAERFIKGMESLARGEDDTSYSGYNAEDPTTGITLPEWLQHRRTAELVVAGLALDYCVGSTAYDFATKTNLDVTLLSDQTKPVARQTGEQMIEKLEAAGVHVMTAAEYQAQIEAQGALL